MPDVKKHLLVCFCSALLLACAQVRSLPGGTKDTTPPKVLAYNPANLTTQFRDKQFSITFDEYIQINNLQDQLIISPPMEKPPKVRVKQHSLVVEFQEELKENVTYTIHFGDAVSDLNENNKALDLFYVFSTGPQVDSLSIRGEVKKAWEGEAGKNFKVLLFENDTAVFSRKISPRYFARTNENGQFTLPYLHEGKYFLYALDDQNANYHWDEGEGFGFLQDSLLLNTPDSSRIELIASMPVKLYPSVGDYIVDSCGSLRFSLEPGYPIGVRSISGLASIQQIDSDSLFFWLSGPPTNLKERIEITGTGPFNDTLEIPFFASALQKTFAIQPLFDSKILQTDSLMISSAVFLSPGNPDYIKILEDSVEIPISMMQRGPNRYQMVCNLKKGKSYEVKILPGAFLNSVGMDNDTLSYAFSTYKTEDLGNIELNIQDSGIILNPLLLVYDKSDKLVFRKENASGSVLVPDLIPGEYTLRLVSDENQNGHFDAAIPRLKIQPEKILVYPARVNVRANWNVKVDWKKA